MSICAHGRPSVNRWRISAAAIIPPLPGLAHVLHVGHVGSIVDSYFPTRGMRHNASPLRELSDRKVVGQLVGGG